MEICIIKKKKKQYKHLFSKIKGKGFLCFFGSLFLFWFFCFVLFCFLLKKTWINTVVQDPFPNVQCREEKTVEMFVHFLTNFLYSVFNLPRKPQHACLT